MKGGKIRMSIDISMTLVSIFLMGGAYLFPADIVHEILGISLFVLWGIHIILNRKWYAAVFCGNYNCYRAMQSIINCGILICSVFLMISGIILSNYVFLFLKIKSGLGFARIAHLLSSHWYLMFMSFHIGLHVNIIIRRFSKRTFTKTVSVAAKIILALSCLYGIYAFIKRGVWRYLILQQEFFFLDFESGYFLFFIDYAAIIVLFATIIYKISTFFSSTHKKNEKKIEKKEK